MSVETPDAAQPIAMEVAADGDEIVFRVRDRGLGIGVEDQARIFEPFFRVERSRARDAGGVGLGLSLVKRIVDAHGGRLELESELGHGSTFSVALPIS